MRHYYLDFVRALLCVLGIPYHAAMIYRADIEWMGFAAEKAVGAIVLAESIHSFRMQAFFVVSGYFATYTFKNMQSVNWLKTRTVRVLVPLVTVSLFFGPFQIIAERYMRHFSANGSEDTLKNFFEIASETSLLEGNWVHHLWFLQNLFIYYVIFFPIANSQNGEKLKRLLVRPCEFFLNRPLPAIFYITVLLGIYTVGLATLGRFYKELLILPLGFVSIVEIFIYIPYFSLGLLLSFKPTLLHKFLHPTKAVLIAASLVFLAVLLSPIYLGQLGLVIRKFLMPISSILTSCIVFYIAHHFFNRHNKFITKLVDSSFTIYILHHPLIVAFGMVSAFFPLNPYFKFMIIMSTTLIFCMAIHSLLKRSAIFMFLFNGHYVRSNRLSVIPSVGR